MPRFIVVTISSRLALRSFISRAMRASTRFATSAGKAGASDSGPSVLLLMVGALSHLKRCPARQSGRRWCWRSAAASGVRRSGTRHSYCRPSWGRFVTGRRRHRYRCPVPVSKVATTTIRGIRMTFRNSHPARRSSRPTTWHRLRRTANQQSASDSPPPSYGQLPGCDPCLLRRCCVRRRHPQLECECTVLNARNNSVAISRCERPSAISSSTSRSRSVRSVRAPG